MRTDVAIRTILTGQPDIGSLPRELITTDRVLQRWAVSIGSGLPTDEWDDTPRAQLPPLPHDVAIEVDQCVLSSPPRTHQLVWRWYKSPQPRETIADRLGMSLRNLHYYRNIALNFMRWKFEGTGNQELMRLVKAIDN